LTFRENRSMPQIPSPLLSIITDRSKLAGLLMILLPVLLVTLDNTILSFALPKIAVALGPSAAEQLWVIDAYSLVLAGLLITMGGVGDRVGYRRLLCVGCTGFAVISVAIVFSQQAWHLIAGRAVLGLFGAMILPATLALIRTAFDDREERRLAVAAWATCLTLGAAAGPLLGGVLLQFFSWQSVFLVAVPFLLPVLLLSPMIPESPKQEAGLPIDYPSILLSLGAMTGMMLSLKHLATVGLDAYAIVGMLMGLLMGIAFVRRQLRLQEPLLDLRLFDSSAFCVSITVNLVSLGALIGFLFFATQLLQLVLGLSPIAASLILLPGQVCAVAAGLAIVPIAQRVAPNIVIPGCLCLAAGAFAVMALFTATALTVALAFVLLNAAVAAITSVSNDLVLSAVPADKAGSASSVSETAYEVGVVLGTTLVGGAVAAWYRVRLVLPEGVEDGAGALTATLGGAHSLAQDLPAEAGTALAEAANTAFSGGVTVTSGLVAGLIVLFALYACRELRQA
jgi:DHA2 family multidrug resistance protein-like MFS transporter